MPPLRFAVFGTGFWSQYQIPGWLELPDVELAAVYNRSRPKAEAIARRFKVPKVYDTPEALLDKETLDFVDIITDVDTHLPMTELAAARGLDIVCQKPMAATYADAARMLETARKAGSRLFINENFRWQAPIRAVKALMDEGRIGEVFKARISFCSAFPVFENQPFLGELDRFILTDIGSHVLDICRFLLGEARNLRCLTRRVNERIKGEDVADVLMQMESGAHCFAEMSYASVLEKEVFPQTLLLVEGSAGSIRLDPDYQLVVATRQGVERRVVEPPLYDWADPNYAVAHASIVDAQRNLLEGLRGGQAETTGEDNLKTVQLVWASYASAEGQRLIHLDDFEPS